jgi:hypothetical protein
VKFKDLFPVLCLALLLISDLFLFSANRQKSTAMAQLTAPGSRCRICNHNWPMPPMLPLTLIPPKWLN